LDSISLLAAMMEVRLAMGLETASNSIAKLLSEDMVAARAMIGSRGFFEGCSRVQLSEKKSGI
jgi:hypothetical protein